MIPQKINQRTNGPVNAHLISWPSKAQNIQNLENIWLRNDLDLQYSHTFIISISCLHLPTFRSLAAIVSEKSTVLTFSHRKNISNQILPCGKIGQGHSKVIICTNYDGLEPPMLHTKFRRNRTAGSREEDF